jgi:hypothetical protein
MTRALALVALAFVVPGGALAAAAERAAPANAGRAIPAPAALTPAGAPGWVVLPVEEYRALRAKADPPAPKPPAPPVEATLTSVEYELRASGTTASGEVRLAIDVFKQGWVRMGVPAGLFVKAARLDGKPTSLVDGDGKDAVRAPAVLLSRPGRSVLALDIDVPVAAGAGSESLVLPASYAAVTRAALTIPRTGVELSLASGLLVEKTESKGESRFVSVAGPGAGLALSWKRMKSDPRAGLPARMRAKLTEGFGLGEEGAQASLVVALEVTQGAVPGIDLVIPEPFVVSQVVGAMVADWEPKPGGLHVRFIDPIEGETAFVVAGEARTPRDGRITLPLLRLPAAEREEGGVAVDVMGAGEIRARDARGLTEADPADLGEIVASRESPSLAAYRFRPGDGRLERGLSVDIVRYTPQAVLMANVEEARYRALLTEDGKTLVQGLYAIRNNQRSFLKVTLPKDATLWSAAVARRPVRPGRTPDGAILLPLEKGRAGEEAPAFLVELVYLERGAAWTPTGSTVFRPPVLDLGTSRTALELYHSPRFRLKAIPGALRAADYAYPTSAAFAPPAQATAQTVGAEVAGIVQGEQVRELPLNGRNFMQLTMLQPGVTAQEGLNTVNKGLTGGSDIAVSGGSTTSNAWFLTDVTKKSDDERRAAEERSRKEQEQARQAAAETQGLVERFQRDAGYGARVTGTLPVQIPVPAIGPQLFFVSELTAEGTAPSLELSYKRDK